MLYVYNKTQDQLVKFNSDSNVTEYFTQLVQSIMKRDVKSVNILTSKGLFTWHINTTDRYLLNKISFLEVLYSKCHNLNLSVQNLYQIKVFKRPLYVNGKAYRISIL